MNEFHWLPSQWTALSVREKALVIAGIDIKLEAEKREAQRQARASKN